MARTNELPSVAVTGASGFVGVHVVRELVHKGYRPVCLVRDAQKLSAVLGEAASSVTTVQGSLFDDKALVEAVGQSNAVIHLVGIIRQAGGGQTFWRVHVEGTKRILGAAAEAGLRRFVHMSALGARDGAVSEYHKTKYAAEEYVRGSGLDWTIFQPSIIHGPDGEFMRMMKAFSKPRLQPGHGPLWLGMPYFGQGLGKVQPVWVGDVAACFVGALEKFESIGRTLPLGGPVAYTWREFYRICSRIIGGKVRRQLGVPTTLARAVAATVMKTPFVPEMLKFDKGAIQMAGEDSVCQTQEVVDLFGIKLRDFEAELTHYADRIP